jgi:hypothetical protein
MSFQKLVYRTGILICLFASAAHAGGLAWQQRSNTGPSARFLHSMAYDSARRVTVLFGGNTAAGYNGETWEWNGDTWTQRTAPGPAARAGAAMTFDSNRNVVVLFGGHNSTTYFPDTWEYNGVSWTVRPVGGVSPRTAAEMTFDSERNVCVLFGGVSGSGYPTNTCEWNGTAWTLFPQAGPMGRIMHAMAFDSSLGVTVLFGGDFQASFYYNDTWEWSGTAWVQTPLGSPPNTPGRLTGFAMAYDAARRAIYLYGGWTADTVRRDDLWERKGTTWTRMPRPPLVPFPRAEHAMVYDSFRRRMVVFGGHSGPPTTARRETFELVPTCPCDLNNDNVVNDLDFELFAPAYNMLDCADPLMPEACPADLNIDGFVDDADFQIFLVGYNTLECE